MINLILRISFPIFENLDEPPCYVWQCAHFAMLQYLNCLGDWHHIYYLLCALPYTTAHFFGSLVFAMLRQYVKRDNMINMITITNLFDTNMHSYKYNII